MKGAPHEITVTRKGSIYFGAVLPLITMVIDCFECHL